jgi:hypothetical protein
MASVGALQEQRIRAALRNRSPPLLPAVRTAQLEAVKPAGQLQTPLSPQIPPFLHDGEHTTVARGRCKQGQ